MLRRKGRSEVKRCRVQSVNKLSANPGSIVFILYIDILYPPVVLRNSNCRNRKLKLQKAGSVVAALANAFAG